MSITKDDECVNFEILKIENSDDNTNQYFVYSWNFKNGYGNYFINGVELSNSVKQNGCLISDDTVITYIPNTRKISHYERDGKTLSVQEYNSKPQTYDCDSSDDETLKAIANKMELSGFTPVYTKIEPIIVSYKVIGFIPKINNKFTTCSISLANKWDKNKTGVFIVNTCNIANDEYMKLSLEYKNHAKFKKIGVNEKLEYVEVNDRYLHVDQYPFKNCVNKTFINYDDAIAEEKFIRDCIRTKIEERIFTQELKPFKTLQLIDRLQFISKVKTKEECDSLISILIDDLSDYYDRIK